jgi:SAM-dependent methyltransferase
MPYMYIDQYIEDNIQENSLVLDLGCGDKRISNRLVKSAKVTTVDIWAKFKPDVLWDLNNTPLPFNDNSFTTILLLDVIEHLDKEKGVILLKEAQRITNTNIFVLTPLWWTENLECIKNSESPYYENPYERHKSLWNEADFTKEWARITMIQSLTNYFFGKWTKGKVK